ncbi:MAG: hypothetical protein IKL08_05880 [Clostridia bacterium]|nr:hypothetical protein [Clostridia bacterium]
MHITFKRKKHEKGEWWFGFAMGFHEPEDTFVIAMDLFKWSFMSKIFK